MKQTIWINVAIGFWLVVAAFTQHSEMLKGVRMVNDFTVGVLMLACALWYLGPMTSDSPDDGLPLSPRGAIVANLLLGAWLIAAPFILSYGALNDVLCGIAAVIVALAAGQPAWRRSAG